MKSLADEIAMAQELAMLDVSKRFKAEIDKSVVLKALPKVKQAVIDEIFDEIDAKAEDEGTAQKEAVFPFDKQCSQEDSNGDDEGVDVDTG